MSRPIMTGWRSSARPTTNFETLPLWKLLSETVNQNARDKSPAPDLAGEVLRAVLTNTRYPATLLNGVALRIRAEREVTRGRAAIVKAYYQKLAETTKQENPDIPEEVLQVSLNPDASNVPYTLGRLFSVLEAIQASANPGINATIKDKYFNSAAATPAVIFPILLNLAQKHLKKLRSSNAGLVVFYEKQLTELCSRIGKAYPAHMNLPQQGSFQLGYYCQTQARYQKKGGSERCLNPSRTAMNLSFSLTWKMATPMETRCGEYAPGRSRNRPGPCHGRVPEEKKSAIMWRRSRKTPPATASM